MPGTMLSWTAKRVKASGRAPALVKMKTISANNTPHRRPNSFPAVPIYIQPRDLFWPVYLSKLICELRRTREIELNRDVREKRMLAILRIPEEILKAIWGLKPEARSVKFSF